MGKRSDFEREERDFYRTPERAVLPLLPHLPAGTSFIEPCAGKGDLVRHLNKHGFRCRQHFDIKPMNPAPMKDPLRYIVPRGNALTFRLPEDQVFPPGSHFITNPPWTRDLMHAIILNLYWQLPTWLLMDADWMHTDQASPYMPMCHKVVSVGRVRWIEGTSSDGKDNAAWYLFDGTGLGPRFWGKR